MSLISSMIPAEPDAAEGDDGLLMSLPNVAAASETSLRNWCFSLMTLLDNSLAVESTFRIWDKYPKTSGDHT